MANINFLSDFSPEAKMQEAQAELKRRSIRFAKCSDYQLKVGPFNFYPGKGTIFKDGDKKTLEKKGLAGLFSLLEQLRPVETPRRNPDEGVCSTVPLDLNDLKK